MLFDTMKPSFIVLLFVFGTLSVVFLLLSVKQAVQIANRSYQKAKAAVLFSLSMMTMLLFIRITAPTKDIVNAIDFLICLAIGLWSLCLVVLLFEIYTRKAENKQKRLYL